MPTILPALEEGAHLQLEGKSLQQANPTTLAYPLYVVRMEGACKKPLSFTSPTVSPVISSATRFA